MYQTGQDTTIFLIFLVQGKYKHTVSCLKNAYKPSKEEPHWILSYTEARADRGNSVMPAHTFWAAVWSQAKSVEIFEWLGVNVLQIKEFLRISDF